MLRNIFLLIFSILLTEFSSATIIHGTVTDDKNVTLPFTNVFIKGTTIGTTSNVDGVYSLDVKPGEYNLVFRIIGFKQHEEKISVSNASIKLDVKLVPESYQLKEVNISASAEDPAYEIIRNAQKKRSYYLNQVESFSSNVYVKSTQKLTSYPKKFFGKPIDLGDIIDSTTGIFYLSESVSKFSFRKPDRVKEEMISSKVSGNSKTYSFNQASDMLLTFYENLVELSGLTPRGIVSPVSSSAMMYYKYRLEGTFVENGETINKIKVIPKRKNDPVFTGDIYIQDDSWRIHSVDLFVAKEQLIEFMDTFRIHQTFIPVEKNVWMALSNQYSYQFSFLGFRGNGTVLGINSDYNIHPGFDKNYFTGEIMKVNADANKKDSAYWKDARLIPLTHEESRDYVKRDSTTQVHESKPYRDSIDRVNNEFSFFNLLFGYKYQNSYDHWDLSFSSIPTSIQFNTVEGWNCGLDIEYNKRNGDGDLREKTLKSNLRYGFSNHHFNGAVSYENKYNRHNGGVYQITAGTAVNQFNPNKPISELINTLYSLWGEKNYMKIYEKRFLEISHRSEITNGVRLDLSAEYAQRIPLTNTTTLHWINVENRDYTPNDPLNPSTDQFHFAKNNSLEAEIGLRIRFRQEYVNRPEGKFVTGTKYPQLRINYRKGIEAIGSDVNYDLIRTGISGDIGFGLLGKLNYEAFFGDFLNDKKVEFMDVQHFNGNKTWFSGFRINDYKLLSYYDYSTTGQFVEGHAEQNFGGFILNKIPLIRKLKLNEIAGVHYLHVDQLKNYLELSFGFEKLDAFRVDFVTSFADGNHVSTGFVFGLKGVF
jgi:hypothetical protein